MSRRLNYADVKQVFEDRGCKLISKTYVRSKDKLDFICSCGRTGKISYDKFSRGQLCAGCRGERISKSSRYTIEQVRSLFRKEGCTLLSDSYINSKQRLRYICECGEESIISLSKLLMGQRCFKCRNKKISDSLTGPNNPQYKYDKTDEERIRERKYPEYLEWRKKVFERDKYTCQCCGEIGGKLNAHHIESFSRRADLRTVLENGVTLCFTCHKEYHTNFCWNDADAESFHEFMHGEYRDPWYAGELKD